MQEQVIAGRGILGRQDIYAIPLLELIERVMMTYQIDWGHRPKVLELGSGQWEELAALLYDKGPEWHECLTVDPPMLYGMRLVQLPYVSGLMAK